MGVRQFVGKGLGLGAAAGVERNIELPLKAPFNVPICLAMAGETDDRAGHLVWGRRRPIGARASRKNRPPRRIRRALVPEFGAKVSPLL
jgi:hypothetical protein